MRKLNEDLKDIAQYKTYLITVKGLAESTVFEYEQDLNAFLYFIMERSDSERDFLVGVTEDIIYDYLSFLTLDKKNQSSTRRRKLSTLSGFYQYMLINKKKITYNPMIAIEKPKKNKRIPTYLTVEEQEKLVAAIPVGSLFEKRNYLILLLMMYLGLRVSEVINLKIKDIQDDYLKIIGKGNKERRLYLNEEISNELKCYLDTHYLKDKPESFLFLSKNKDKLSRQAIFQLIEKLRKNANLINKSISPHTLRHTAATNLHRKNIDILTIQKILGHESLETTQIYTHIEDSAIRDALANVIFKKHP